MTRLSLMILLQLAAAHKGWFIICADITGAFLQGDQALAKRKEPVFVRQPKEGLPGLHPGQLLLVVRGIFGLANSPRLFWRHLWDSMVKLGFAQSTLDKAVFLFYQDKRQSAHTWTTFYVWANLELETKSSNVFEPSSTSVSGRTSERSQL